MLRASAVVSGQFGAPGLPGVPPPAACAHLVLLYPYFSALYLRSPSSKVGDHKCVLCGCMPRCWDHSFWGSSPSLAVPSVILILNNSKNRPEPSVLVPLLRSSHSREPLRIPSLFPRFSLCKASACRPGLMNSSKKQDGYASVCLQRTPVSRAKVMHLKHSHELRCCHPAPPLGVCELAALLLGMSSRKIFPGRFGLE